MASAQHSPREGFIQQRRSQSVIPADVREGRLVVFEPQPDPKIFDFKDYVSSLHMSDPKFNYPALQLDEGKENTWKEIAGNILTAFAPKVKLYDYEKFLHSPTKNEPTFLSRSFSGYHYYDDSSPFRSPTRKGDSPMPGMDSPMKMHRGQNDDAALETVKKNNMINFIYNPMMNSKTLTMNKKITQALKMSPFDIRTPSKRDKRYDEDLAKTIKLPLKQRAEVIFGEKFSTGVQDDTPIIISRQTRHENKMGLNANRNLIIVPNEEKNNHRIPSPRPQKPWQLNKQKSMAVLDKDMSSLSNSIDLSDDPDIEIPTQNDQPFQPEPISLSKFSNMKNLGVVEDSSTKRERRDSFRPNTPQRKKSSLSRYPTLSTPNGGARPGSNFGKRENAISGSRSELESVMNTETNKRKYKKIKGIYARRKSDVSKWSGGECLKLTKHQDILLWSDFRRFEKTEKTEHQDPPGTADEQRNANIRKDPVVIKPFLKKLGTTFLDGDRKGTGNSGPRPGSNGLGMGLMYTTHQSDITYVSKGQKDIDIESSTYTNQQAIDNKKQRSNILFTVGTYTAKRIKVVPPIAIKTLENPNLKPTIEDLYYGEYFKKDIEFFDLKDAATLKKENKVFTKRLKKGDLKPAMNLVLKNNPRANDIFSIKKKKPKPKGNEWDLNLPFMKTTTTNFPQPAATGFSLIKSKLFKTARSNSVNALMTRPSTTNSEWRDPSPYKKPQPFTKLVHKKSGDKALKAFFILPLNNTGAGGTAGTTGTLESARGWQTDRKSTPDRLPTTERLHTTREGEKKRSLSVIKLRKSQN